MDKFRCELCAKIEKYVHVCGAKHLVCERCVANIQAPDQTPQCSCGSELQAVQRNPLDTLIEEKCQHRGCTWAFVAEELAEHRMECRYRPYKCLGTTLKIWSCDWSGRQIDFPVHLAVGHPELGAVLPHNAADRIKFNGDQTMGTLNLVNAFSRQFVFFYYTDAGTQMVNFVVFLLGLRSAAARYYVEFQLNYGSAVHERLEFVTPCVSDVVDIHALLAAERCIVLTHRAAQKYMDDDGCLRFRFFIKEKTAKAASAAATVENANGNKKGDAEVAKKAAKEPGKAPAKKVSVPVNATKKNPPPVTNAGGIKSGGHAPLSSRVPAAGTELPKFQEIHGKPTATLSSINQPAATVQQWTNPISSFGKHESQQQPMFRPQPYKAVDDKFYTVKYPHTSIQKPVYKK